MPSQTYSHSALSGLEDIVHGLFGVLKMKCSAAITIELPEQEAYRFLHYVNYELGQLPLNKNAVSRIVPGDVFEYRGVNFKITGATSDT